MSTIALFGHHDDAAREFAYDRADQLQPFDNGIGRESIFPALVNPSSN